MLADLNRLIDNGKTVVVFKNAIGSYTSFAVEVNHEDIENAGEYADVIGHLTDDFTPEESVKRLADKVMGVGDYAESEAGDA